MLRGLTEQFAAFFSGLTRAHGVHEPSPAIPGEKAKGKSYTVEEPVTIEIYDEHLDGVRGMGVVPIRDDGTLSFGAIDIDVYDLDLAALEKKIIDKSLPLVVCRTKSGGAHAYLFLKTPTPAGVIIKALRSWAHELGYGKSEIFPKQEFVSTAAGSIGNWINLPYFEANDTQRYAIKNGNPITFIDFLNYAKERAIDWIAYQQSKTSDVLFEAPPCLVALAEQTITTGSRNNGLFNFAVYARLRFEKSPNQAKSDWEEELRNINETYFSPPLLPVEVREVVKSSRRKTYFYTCNRDPVRPHCNKEQCKHRQFGIAAFETAPDVQLEGLTKIMTDPPTWVALVDGQSLELTTDDLMMQSKFRKVCLERLNKIPRALSAPVWEQHLGTLLANVVVVEAPKDASVEGQFLAHVETFCTGRAQARSIDEILQGKPWTDNGRTYFRSTDLNRFLSQQQFRDLTKPKMWAILKRSGGTAQDLELKGKATKVWSVPEFGRQREPFDVPNVKGAF